MIQAEFQVEEDSMTQYRPSNETSLQLRDAHKQGIRWFTFENSFSFIGEKACYISYKV